MTVPPLRTWLFETVLPFWADRGVDREHGGFYEALDLDGHPLPGTAKRLRVQARQIYTFSHAHLAGAGSFALPAARHGYAFLTRFGRHEGEEGWVHLLTPDGAVLEATRDLYDHAFVLLALAWYARATGEAEPLALIRHTVDWLDRELLDPVHGGYAEALTPDRRPPLPRRQNPHMHLFEALLALHETTGNGEWLDRAERLLALLHQHFFDESSASVAEFFTADWQPAPGTAGTLREPGHAFEWVWLLHSYRKASGDTSVIGPAARLLEAALATGVDTAPGMVPAAFDETDAYGRLRRDTKRLWPQTELLKALAAAQEAAATAQDPYAEIVDRHLGVLFRTQLDAASPLWHDQIARDGRRLAQTVPASTLYHLYLATLETARVYAR